MGEKLTLGYEDVQANGETNIYKAIDSYNKAVNRINDYCKEQITNPETQKENIRSVGSNPSNPYDENTTKYTSDNLAKWLGGEYNNVGNSTDSNYEQDWIRIKYLDLPNLVKYYWIPTRYVSEDASKVTFNVMYLAFNRTNFSTIYDVTENLAKESGNSLFVRPIVKIPNV